MTIFVPDEVEVSLTGTAALGAKSSQRHGAPLPGAPVINVHAKAVLGSVTVRSLHRRRRKLQA